MRGEIDHVSISRYRTTNTIVHNIYHKLLTVISIQVNPDRMEGWLDGGTGNDELSSGKGADKFDCGAGKERTSDFNPQDVISTRIARRSAHILNTKPSRLIHHLLYLDKLSCTTLDFLCYICRTSPCIPSSYPYHEDFTKKYLRLTAKKNSK